MPDPLPIPSPTGTPIVPPKLVPYLLLLGAVLTAWQGAMVYDGTWHPDRIPGMLLAVLAMIGVASPGARKGDGRALLVLINVGLLLASSAAHAKQRGLFQSDAPVREGVAPAATGEHPVTWGVLVVYDGGAQRLGQGVFLAANALNLGPVGLGAGALLGAAQSLQGLPPSTLTGLGLTLRLFDGAGYVGGLAGLVTTDPLCAPGARCAGWAVGLWGAPSTAFPAAAH